MGKNVETTVVEGVVGRDAVAERVARRTIASSPYAMTKSVDPMNVVESAEPANRVNPVYRMATAASRIAQARSVGLTGVVAPVEAALMASTAPNLEVALSLRTTVTEQ